MCLAVGLTMPSLPAAAATGSGGSNAPGSKAQQLSDLDRLAGELSEFIPAHRLHGSVLVQLSDNEVFSSPRKDPDRLSPEGRKLVSKMAKVLARYPGTFIYVQENVSAAADSRRRAVDQALLIQDALLSEGIDIARLEIDVTTPAEPRGKAKIDGRTLRPRRFMELRIVPRE